MDAVSPEHWFVTGTTASGKTAVGVELARLLDAEIISVDSMAIYRGMDLGTAKPTAQERARVPHHLIDVAPPNELFNLHDYLTLAHQAVSEIVGRGRQVLFVGGTPLYLKALLRGVFEGPPADREFRRQVQEELSRVGPEALHQRLGQVDPLSAARLHPHNTRRIIRALEVYKLTGRPISHLQLQFERPPVHRRIVALHWPRIELHRRADERVDAIFQQGLFEEVQDLLARYGALSRTASQAVGYREAIEYLEGNLTRPQAIDRTKIRTHRLARQQETWFRAMPEIVPMPMWDEPPGATASRILSVLRARG